MSTIRNEAYPRLRPSLPQLPASALRRRLLSCSLALPFAHSLPSAAQHSPESVDLDWHDSGRDRPIPVRLYLPAGRRTGDPPAALVVFSHGLGGSRQGYSWLGSHWAANGIASLHVQHIGSDRTIWVERGNPLALVGRMHDAITDREALARAYDLRFALDQLAASNFSTAIDTRRVVAAGHSYGANTSLLLSGARIERFGFDPRIADPRVAAAILISAPPFHGEGEPGPILAPIRIPTLHVTATEDVIRVPGFYSDLEDRIAIFDAMAARDKTLVIYAGGAHGMFTDRSAPGGLALNRLVKNATRELVLGFVDRTLRGRTEHLDGWADRHAAILARFVDSPVARA